MQPAGGIMNHPVQYIDSYNMASENQVITSIYLSFPSLKSMDIATRISEISAAFLGKPYLEGTAGEGHEGRFDQSPQYRFDAFDCVTLVNAVLALALSNDVVSFRKNLCRIAYRGAQLGYQYRHHFMSVDWNLNNEAIGITEDITASIMDASIIEYAEAVIDRPNWFRHRRYEDIKLLEKISSKNSEKLLQELHALAETLAPEVTRMPYLPIKKLFDDNANPIPSLFDRIPHASIIEIVRPDWKLRDKIGTNLNVSHVGFAIRKDDVLLYRQASSIERRVMDIPLAEYLSYRLESPTIKGINVQRVLRNP
jgi:hypothetical protein